MNQKPLNQRFYYYAVYVIRKDVFQFFSSFFIMKISPVQAQIEGLSWNEKNLDWKDH